MSVLWTWLRYELVRFVAGRVVCPLLGHRGDGSRSRTRRGLILIDISHCPRCWELFETGRELDLSPGSVEQLELAMARLTQEGGNPKNP